MSEGNFRLANQDTVKNGTMTYATDTITVYVATGADVTLEGLTVRSDNAGAFMAYNATVSITDCTLEGSATGTFFPYGLSADGSSVVTAENVTFSGRNGAYTVDDTATLTPDGNVVTGKCAETTYITPGRS